MWYVLSLSLLVRAPYCICMFGEWYWHFDGDKGLGVDQTGPDPTKWARSPRRVCCACFFFANSMLCMLGCVGKDDQDKMVSGREGRNWLKPAHETSWQLTKPSGDLPWGAPHAALWCVALAHLRRALLESLDWNERRVAKKKKKKDWNERTNALITADRRPCWLIETRGRTGELIKHLQ
jgi:hypothetical protein